MDQPGLNVPVSGEAIEDCREAERVRSPGEPNNNLRTRAEFERFETYVNSLFDSRKCGTATIARRR